MAEIITMDDIRRMYKDSEDMYYVVSEYCEENGIDYTGLSEEEELDIYEELYPISAFLKDYYENIFYGDKYEPDEDVESLYRSQLNGTLDD